jgi:membrane associated rhomboid family serine protease
MKTQSHLPLRVLLWFIAVYHIVAGVAATFFQDAAVGIGSLLFGVKITMDPQTTLLVRYLGAFGIAFGLMATLAALDPERHKGFIYGAVIYFVVRAFDRVAFAGLLAEYSVGFMPNWGRIIVILLFAVGLLVFLPRQKAPPELTAGAG